MAAEAPYAKVSRRSDRRVTERGLAMTGFAVVMGLIIVGLGTAYLAASSAAHTRAVLRQEQAVLRAAVRGGVYLALASPEAREGREGRVEATLGACRVTAEIKPSEGGRVHVTVEAVLGEGAAAKRLGVGAIGERRGGEPARLLALEGPAW